ncbi:MAG TPA: hypothetical protein VMI35_09195 [Puia sp.]|nr:hypothetical protein [Puia sp.]
MKKYQTIVMAAFLFAGSFAAKAQTATVNYFAGSWTVLLKGTPSGDVKMIFVLDKKADSLAGVVQDSTGTEISKISNIERNENQITVYFTAQGYDVNLVLTKKDEDHVTGSLMGMFDAEGERKKANRQ